ncbi:MAG: chorismate mutase [Spirochaetaceae bacterium]|jgi:chorismate mutase|nr:chorismate mutase [Spirochaetaceae bacterium]
MKKLAAIRGAVCVENDPADIVAKTARVYDLLTGRNGIREEDIVSLVFSVTNDIDAKNPAAALRESGRARDLALFSVQEPYIKGGLPRVIRLLLHCYIEENAVPAHIYIEGAEALRPDRTCS